MKKVKRIVYTVCTGGFDIVHPPRFRERNTRYILFTDGEPVDGWECVHWTGGRRESREPKILAHKHLPPHSESLYHDACVRLDVPPSTLFNMLRLDFAACDHPNDRSLSEHFSTCLKFRLCHDEDIMRQKQKYRDAGMRIDAYPCSENTLILRRNTARAREINAAWWAAYCAGSERDQLALPFALWQTGYSYQPLPFQSRVNRYYSGWCYHVDRKCDIKRKRAILITVVDGADAEALHLITGPLMRAYAAAHGYDFEVMRSPAQRNGFWPSPSWWKLETINRFSKYEWVIFADNDLLIKVGAPDILNGIPEGKFASINSLTIPYMANPQGGAIKSYRAWLKAVTGRICRKKLPFMINGGGWACHRNAQQVLECLKPVELDGYVEQHQLNFNLYQEPDLYFELPRCWNFGHLHRSENYDAAQDNRLAHWVHLNGAEDKLAMARDILQWPCFVPPPLPEKRTPHRLRDKQPSQPSQPSQPQEQAQAQPIFTCLNPKW